MIGTYNVVKDSEGYLGGAYSGRTQNPEMANTFKSAEEAQQRAAMITGAFAVVLARVNGKLVEVR